jgi:hypothetical protein
LDELEHASARRAARRIDGEANSIADGDVPDEDGAPLPADLFDSDPFAAWRKLADARFERERHPREIASTV